MDIPAGLLPSAVTPCQQRTVSGGCVTRAESQPAFKTLLGEDIADY